MTFPRPCQSAIKKTRRNKYRTKIFYIIEFKGVSIAESIVTDPSVEILTCVVVTSEGGADSKYQRVFEKVEISKSKKQGEMRTNPYKKSSRKLTVTLAR